MIARTIGGVLLIVGSAIGGGILALPIATSELGFINSSILLFFCWLLMTISALLILEVTLWLPKNTNIISMAKMTLGPLGQIVAWITYFLLLYSLLAAYIAGGSDFFQNLFDLIHVNLPHWIVAVLFTLVLGYVVYLGIHAVDYVNRGLMTIKFIAFFLLIGLIFSHISPSNLSGGEVNYISSGVTVAITSFGYATIIPSLRNYFHDDVKKLRLVVLIGSFIPLICYIAWDMTVMGVIPREGSDGLISMLHSGRSTSDFVNQLSLLLNRESITSLSHIFTSICLLTSFIGVALCLVDFLADGFQTEKKGKVNFLICSAALIPPLLIVLINPGIFIGALAYAGIYCIILLVVLPTLMVWRGRYHKKIASGYKVLGGKPLLLILLIVSALIILQSFASSFMK
ncbi:MAG TPA: aromatic amino acid transport family protein [Gammaproteobacteria bacterium]|nr:aromatic amino acid transport family protein [Gammaproteobacteria bacterium]